MDKRSLGKLFYLTIDELEDLHYLDALASLLSLLMDCSKEAKILDEEQINQLFDLFLAKLPHLWGKCLKQCVCCDDNACLKTDTPYLIRASVVRSLSY